MSLKLSLIPATAAAIAPTDLMYLAKDMGAGVWLEHKLPVSVFNSAYQATLGFTPENVANKDTDGTLAANSNIRYPSQQAVKTYVDALAAASSAAFVLKVGDTMTGLLQFSGTTHAGIRLNNLTTAQRDAIAAPTAGMTVWNTTTTALNSYTGATWTAVTTGGPYLPLAGGTMLGNILFSPDNTLDIGATLATRPRTAYLGTSLVVERPALGATTALAIQLVNSTAATVGASQYSPGIRFQGQGWATTPANSQSLEWRVYASAVNGLATPSAMLNVELSIAGGAFSPYAQFLSDPNGQQGLNLQHSLWAAANVVAGGVGVIGFSGRSFFSSPSSGVIVMRDSAFTSFTRLNFGGTTSAFPALGRNGTILEVLAADGAATASLAIYNTKTSTTNFERLDLRWTTNVAEIFTEKGSGGGTARDLVLGADATEVLRFTSAGATYAVAKTLGFRQGTNTRAGNATLVAGTVTVANTTVTANTLVMLTRKTSGGTLGTAITYTVTAATSFTINSDSALDTSTFSYVLIENPA